MGSEMGLFKLALPGFWLTKLPPSFSLNDIALRFKFGSGSRGKLLTKTSERKFTDLDITLILN
jgi:hypothetical protein